MNEILKTTIDPLSYTSVPISMINIESRKILSTATGFFYRNGDTFYLITNWHNITGINPQTKKRLSDASPTGLIIPMLSQKVPYIIWNFFTIPLYDSDNKPLWYIHPLHKEQVDVVAIKLDKNNSNLMLKAINDINFDDFKPLVADHIFILGFPHNINSGGNFPIWKKGSVSSEPDIDLENLPKILVDTASRSGMSGSPVIFRRSGIHNIKNEKPVDETIIGEIQNFVGIYSGRMRIIDELDTQLGIVWKASVIEQILEIKQLDNLYYPDNSFI